MIVGSNISHQKTIIFVYVVNKSIHLMIIVSNEVQLCLSINARYVSSNLAIAILDPIKFRQTSGSYRINPHFLCLSCYQAYIYHFLSLASIHPHFAGTSGEDCVGLCSKDCKYSYLLSIKWLSIFMFRETWMAFSYVVGAWYLIEIIDYQ